MNTTQKIGLVSGVAWLVIVGAVYIAGAVLTGSFESGMGVRPRGGRAHTVDLEDDRCPRRHQVV